uniref:C2H2-type domain-containing protein n=1 Tax=Lutzomyia longipalpis TaxID=7200 RepID=A0A1B0C8K8_LUTLO
MIITLWTLPRTFYQKDCDVDCVKDCYVYEYGEDDDVPTDSLIFEIVNLFEETGSVRDIPQIFIKQEQGMPLSFVGYDGFDTIVEEIKAEEEADEIEPQPEFLNYSEIEDNNFLPDARTEKKRKRTPKKMWTEGAMRTKKSNQKQRKIPSGKARGEFVCEICNKTCISELGLKLHVSRHIQKPPRSCKYCDEFFPTIYKLKCHIAASHPDIMKTVQEMKENKVKPVFYCSICSKSFPNLSLFKRHSRMHSSTPDVVCDICGQKLKHKTSLADHMTIHTGERPFKCTFPECTRSFRCKVSIDIHMRSHTNERPYICQTCGKGFKDNSSRRVHQLQHTGENPFKCDLCGKTTKQKQNLKSHMRHFHKINIET